MKKQNRSTKEPILLDDTSRLKIALFASLGGTVFIPWLIFSIGAIRAAPYPYGLMGLEVVIPIGGFILISPVLLISYLGIRHTLKSTKKKAEKKI